MEILIGGVIAIVFGLYRRSKWMARQKEYDRVDEVEPLSYIGHIGRENAHYLYLLLGVSLLTIYVLGEVGMIPKE